MISPVFSAPLGGVAGYWMINAGNIWIGIMFLFLSIFSFLLTVATVCRYFINLRRKIK